MNTSYEQLRRRDHLKSLCLALNVLIVGHDATVYANLNGTRCPIHEVVAVQWNEIEVYGPKGFYGAFPSTTEFSVSLNTSPMQEEEENA